MKLAIILAISTLASAQVYSARTDLNIAQAGYPPTVRAGANTIVFDPDFGTRVVRATDKTTDRNVGFNVGTGRRVFNADSTRFVFVSNDGWNYVANFDPVGMTVRLNPAWEKIAGSFSWSSINRDVLYSVQGSKIVKYTFDGDVSTESNVFDFAPWVKLPNYTWRSNFTVGAGDMTFAVGFSAGPQGTGFIACQYTVGKGARVLNTQTGRVSGQWGVLGTIDIPDRFFLHEVGMSAGGDYVILGRNISRGDTATHSNYYWQADSLKVTYWDLYGNQAVEGHPAQGYVHTINAGGEFGGEVIRPYTDLLAWRELVPVIPSGIEPPFDSHSSWNNDDPEDTNPFCNIVASVTRPFPAAWYNEVLMIDPVDGTVYREAHTYNTGTSVYFSTANAIGSVSTDGRFVIFPSDWMKTLGTDKAGQPLGSLFIVELR
ncbi:MAG TPA: hypothetical protein VGN39_00015 [Terriglobales bacterium]|jgi:hypothetical protein|nr:hypothetical protein [Terriglobales bacterium]